MVDCMGAVCQRRQSLVVFKRDVQLCIIGLFPVWAATFAKTVVWSVLECLFIYLMTLLGNAN